MKRATKKQDAIPDRKTGDVAFAKNPEEWPRWPLLPVKHTKRASYEANYVGFIFSDGKPVVYLNGILSLPKAEPGMKWEDVLTPMKKETYTSFDELFNDWRID